MSETEEYFVRAYLKAEFDCPACGEVNQVDHDPAGETTECAHCVMTITITETI